MPDAALTPAMTRDPEPTPLDIQRWEDDGGTVAPDRQRRATRPAPIAASASADWGLDELAAAE